MFLVAGGSELESLDNNRYFFCSPRYKYSKSKRKNRVTKNGYWKPTGKPRKIVTTYKYNGKEITGTRQTLRFYKSRVSDKNKKENRTHWVMYEFELTVNLPNQKSLTLCKLKKKYGKVDVSRDEEGQSSHLLPSNLENHITNDAIPKDQLNSGDEPLTETEAFTEYSGIQSEFTTNDDDDKFVDSLLINNFVDEDEDPMLSSNFQVHAADYDIPKNQEGFSELINQKPKAPNDCVGTLNEVRTSEHDNSSRSSILIGDDQTYSKEGSSLLAGNEGSGLALENTVAIGSIPQDDGFWNSIFFITDAIEAYTQDLGGKRQNLAAKNEDFNFSARKRPRIESERLTSEANIEAGPPSGKEKLF
ncbi:hypothetical protein DITRI_Ditri11bG0131800 [Diplodiscus trichospermus]